MNFLVDSIPFKNKYILVLHYLKYIFLQDWEA